MDTPTRRYATNASPNRTRYIGLALLSAPLLLLGTAARSGARAPVAPTSAAASQAVPSAGWTLHADAKLHFPSNPEMVAHHYCKGVAGGVTECQIYDSDRPDARLGGIEAIIERPTFATLNPYEQPLWHDHKIEIPKSSSSLPDLSPEEAAPIVRMFEETYGKIFIVWDFSRGNVPLGQPGVTLIP